MLDHFNNQASGLLGLGSQSGPRMIAVVSHGDELAELPLLWQLCQALVNFAYSVTVLDATCIESESNPGLEQLMDNSLCSDDGAQDAPAWAVLPSARGIQKLYASQDTHLRGLQQLGHLFPTEGIVVLYCNAQAMIALTGGSRVEPLVPVSPVRSSLLTGYAALKRLLITGGLQPTIINMIQDNDSVAAAHPVSLGLSECAKKFLGQEVKALDISEQRGGTPLDGEIQRLALRLLERSVTLNMGNGPLRSDWRSPQGVHPHSLAGSH